MKHLINRVDTILACCKDKDVLDIGSTGQTGAYDLWPMLESVAKTLVGIDIIPRGDKRIVEGDMETYKFGKTFDVIIAGDVLEHVMNQGLFLVNIRQHLAENGTLIITTPNAKWPTVFFKPNPTHTLWHDRHTVRYLLEHAGFRVESIGYYLGNKPRYPWWLRIFVWRQGMLIAARSADI